MNTSEGHLGKRSVALFQKLLNHALIIAERCVNHIYIFREAIESWYRERALEHLQERVAAWAPVVGDWPSRVSVGDARSRWGSCSPRGALRFSWRLVMATPDLLEYVVVHELVHLRVRDHSAKFWSEVARLLPDCKERRKRLRDFGRSSAEV